MSFSAARAEVFLLPLAAADPDAVRALGVDPGILCRRIPDFLHQLVNQGEPGPTALVELQAPDDTGEIAWADLREPMDPEEALDLLPEGCSARALVCGTLSAADGELAVDL
ncbi:MAG TPA: hypothetical protein VK081_06860, partial [Planctomycetota bacterium]|nr:hypothetical protein [Planctomycetota bacterium]